MNLPYIYGAGWKDLSITDSLKAKRAMAEYRKTHPVCEVTGSSKGVQIHHIIPVWQAPEKAADMTNFIALSSKAHIHLIFGHDNNFARRYVANVADLARRIRDIRAEADVVHRPAPLGETWQFRWFRRLAKFFSCFAVILCSTACATKVPGGESRLTTSSYHAGDVIYNGIGVRF